MADKEKHKVLVPGPSPGKGEDEEETHLCGDWTIELSRSSTTERDQAQRFRQSHVFVVPMRILARGERKCGYFARLFESGTFSESQTKTSHLQVDQLAITAFPQMLDYMSDESTPLSITTETATALYYLADYFENDTLGSHVEEFLKSDIALANSGMYYKHSKALQTETITEMIAARCGTEIRQIEPAHEIVQIADLNFWQEVMKRKKSDANVNYEREYNSPTASRLLLEVFKKREAEISPEMFHDLLKKDYIQKIAGDAALDLLLLGQKFAGSRDETSCLQNRRLRALTELSCSEFRGSQARLEKLPPSLLASLVMQRSANGGHN